MDKHIVVQSHNGTLCSNTKEKTNDTNKKQWIYLKVKEPKFKNSILYDLNCMTFRKR